MDSGLQTGKYRRKTPEQVWADAPDLPAGAQAHTIQYSGDAAEAIPPSVEGSGSRGSPIGVDHGWAVGTESGPGQSS